jgi:hypothetical protein
VEPRQSDWWLLSHLEEGIVLVCPNGRGSLSPAAVERARAVLIVDDDLCRLKSASILANKYALDAVVPLYVKDDMLPVRSNSISTILLTDHGGAPEPDRLRLGGETLTDGGNLCLRIHNRYDVRTLSEWPTALDKGRHALLEAVSPVLATRWAANSEGKASRREVRSQLAAADFNDIETRYGVPDPWQPQYFFSDADVLVGYLRDLVSIRYSDRARLLKLLLTAGIRLAAKTGAIGATAPALFFRATWNGTDD